MNSDPSVPLQRSLWRRLLAFKTLLLSLSLVAMLATNVASLVNANAHDWMHNALSRLLSVGGQVATDRALSNSLKGRATVLEAKNKELELKNRSQTIELAHVNAKNQNLVRKFDVSGKQAKETVSTVHKRLAKGISRNLASIRLEAVPFVGIGVTLAMTSMDIYDACQTMKDFNALLQAMGQGEETPDLCGQKVPTREEVIKATCASASVPYLCSSK